MFSIQRRRLYVLTSILGVAILTTGAVLAQRAQQSDRSGVVRSSINAGRAKNVILLIGDGMGDSEITIARNYAVGAGGRLALDSLPLTGAMTTYAVLETNPKKPVYTPESASTATAWSTGFKTANGRISTSAGTDKDLKTIIQLAKAAGYRTGNVTTAELTDATPAAPMANVASRSCQGPLDMALCPQDAKSEKGPGSIAEQSIDLGVDVLLGGGKARYAQTIDFGPYAGQTVIQSAVSQGYSVITKKSELLAAQPGKKLLGLFNAGNMSVQWTGQPAAKPASGPQRCQTGQRPRNEPSLSEMTTKALQLLSKRTPGSGGKGFFLQVESASIDKRDHVSQPCEQIGETINFDEAVRVALDFAKQNPNTLIIVTGDHSHTSQITDNDATPAGFSSKLITKEGEIMTVTYGTGDTPTGQRHTGSQLRVAAQGPQAANVVGVIDQTKIFQIMVRALNIFP
jgi:alkaline phosphatase/streptomycin-6-phosphatase